MPQDYIDAVGDGVTTVFPLNFADGFIAHRFLRVWVGDEILPAPYTPGGPALQGTPNYRAFEFATSLSIHVFGPVPAVGERVRIIRILPNQVLVSGWYIGLDGAVGPGVPVGGTVGQVLTKLDSVNYNAEWANPAPASVADGDKGDVVVSAGGTVWTLDAAVVASFASASHTHPFSSITSTPTTISGYGITDFNSLGDARWALLGHVHAFSSLTGTPTTVAGYGITDFNSLGDARWSLTGHVHVAANITDFNAAADARVSAGISSHEAAGDPHPQYMTQTEADALYSVLAHTHSFASLTAKPTTIAGYGITDFNSLGDARWSLLAHTHSGLAPAGGSTGQVLKKINNTDYNYSWQADATGGGSVFVATSVTVLNNSIEHTQNIVDASVVSTSVIELKYGIYADTDENDPELLDIVTMYAKPLTGSFDVILTFNAPTSGIIKLAYRIS